MSGRKKKKDDPNSAQLELVNGEIIESKDHGRYFMSEAALEQRRKASEAHALKKYENHERLEFLAEVAKLSAEVIPNDPDSMLIAFNKYIMLAAERGQAIGNMTAYMAMHTNHFVMRNWYLREDRKNDPRCYQLAAYVHAVCAAYREQAASDGHINPILAIFWQKNFDGLTNEDRLFVEERDPLGNIKDTKEIAEKYKDIPDD